MPAAPRGRCGGDPPERTPLLLAVNGGDAAHRKALRAQLVALLDLRRDGPPADEVFDAGLVIEVGAELSATEAGARAAGAFSAAGQLTPA